MQGFMALGHLGMRARSTAAVAVELWTELYQWMRIWHESGILLLFTNHYAAGKGKDQRIEGLSDDRKLGMAIRLLGVGGLNDWFIGFIDWWVPGLAAGQPGLAWPHL
jgi:hypothetical protein